MRKIAVDANLLVRNAARRLIPGTAELTGYGVIVPETAGSDEQAGVPQGEGQWRQGASHVRDDQGREGH